MILNIIALIIVDVAYIPYHFKNLSTKGENSEDVKKLSNSGIGLQEVWLV